MNIEIKGIYKNCKDCGRLHVVYRDCDGVMLND